VTVDFSFSVTVVLVWTISLLTDLLKEGARMMLSFSVMCGGAFARGQFCLCHRIVTGQNTVFMKNIAPRLKA